MPNWCLNTIYFDGDTTELKTAIADAVSVSRVTESLSSNH
jgi:hypothetical protein